MRPFSWKCPYCNQTATITVNNVHESSTLFAINNKDGDKKLVSFFIVCPNEDCNKYTLSSILYDSKFDYDTNHRETGEIVKRWNLIPPSNAKVFPEYVPKPIILDYEEACAILDKSPKASATLARRCLQGMIRDFFGIKKGRLLDEINAIEDKVNPLTWQSIDAVRKIGNIGAHMEKDINLIIDVDPEEANILLQLIEQLIEDWYITRHEREKRLNKIIAISKEKESEKKNNNL